ncbi:MAG: hypothetical protein J5562_01000 [Clostridia bacterium]|nr:hypothetical protein [Clostridia bacterium]
MSEISALPGAVVECLSEIQALEGIKFTTEYPACPKTVPLSRTTVSVGIESVRISDSFTANNEGVLERDEYCRNALVKLRFGVHAPFALGGGECYDAFTLVIDALSFGTDLEIVSSGCEGITADRDTEAFVLKAYAEIKANLCPADTCDIPFPSFMDKELLCGSHIRDEDIHLSAAQRAYLTAPTATGSYFGTDASYRSFHLGYRPRAVFVGTQSMPAVHGGYVYSGFACDGFGTAGVTLTDDGFSVTNTTSGGITTRLNDSENDYFYIALK